MKKTFVTLFKIILTAVIFYFLLKDFDLALVYEELLKANGLYLCIASALIVGMVYILSLRWFFINKIFGYHIPSTTLYKHYLIAYAFNVFLPSSVGGDIWRIRVLNKESGNKGTAFFSPFIERITGMLSMVCVLPIVFFGFDSFLEKNNLGGLFYLFLFGITCILVFLFTSVGIKLLERIQLNLSSDSIKKNLSSLQEIIQTLQKNKSQVGLGIIFSLLTHVAVAVACWFVVLSFGQSLDIFQMYFICILMFVTVTIPITINGFGVREATLIWGMELYLIETNIATVIALIISFLQLIPSIFGAILFLISKEELNE